MNYTQPATKPGACQVGKTECSISGPQGMNSKGVIWRCSTHHKLFVAGYFTGEALS